MSPRATWACLLLGIVAAGLAVLTASGCYHGNPPWPGDPTAPPPPFAARADAGADGR